MAKGDLKKDLAKARKALGLNGQSQQEILRKAREVYGMTNDELAGALEISMPTLLAYLAPSDAAKFRRMAEADKLILARVLAAKRK